MKTNLQIARLGTLGALMSIALSACALPIPPPMVKAPVAPAEVPAAAKPVPAVPLYKNLGAHSRKISANSPQTQQYFDQGLILIYAFNHDEAIKMFKEAIRLDPTCAMCYWGIAYALGPNINAYMADAAVPEAFAAAHKAHELASNASPAERDLIAALTQRYGSEPVKDRTALDKAYADAMRGIAKKYPDDADVNTLFAEALMDLMPWNFWTKDGKPTDYTEEILATLEGVMKRTPDHPGANHYYIHATEASFNPERAIPSADRLLTLVPDAGHLVHMPAHVYWRVGRYHDAADINKHAIHVDEGGNFKPDQRGNNWYSVGYYPHNIHFLHAATSMEGRSADALAAARKLVADIPHSVYEESPFMQDLATMPLLTLVRFGKWKDILSESQPPADLPYVMGIWHYAQGMAMLRTGKLDDADKALAQVNALAQNKDLQALGLSTFATAGQLLSIAGNILEGELAGARGNTQHQIEHLETAARLQDELPYIEPPSWNAPVRHMLGAALLEANRAADAEAVYRVDLRQYPRNGWSLFGLAQSLKAQGKDKDAAEMQKQFEVAWQYADVKLSRSRF